MKYSEARHGRVFVIRLEDGDVIHEEIERFAKEKAIKAASVIIVGGVDAGSRLVTGPLAGRASPVVPMELVLDAPHEVAGVGTIFPDDSGSAILHMHMACGRHSSTTTGCVRRGVKTWHVLEVILTELLDCRAARLPDAVTGFKLLSP